MLHFVAYLEGVPQPLRRRIRQTLRGEDAEQLKVWDQERRSRDRKLEQHRRQWKERRRRAEREAPPIFELEPLVREILDSKEIELLHKMLQLSWYCFEPPSQRPSNLSGQWENLPADLRDEVITVCREALVQCPPTDIPLSASYSRWTSWEAACFHHLVSEDAAFVLTSEMIQKWLPALLRTWVTGSGFEPTLRRCFEVDRNLAEGLLCQEIRRSVLTEKGTYILQYLPPELWSERFASLLEAIVADPQVKPETRIDLLVRIARIFPVRARPIASAWADGEEVTLRNAGIDLLLMVAPEEGWKYFKALAERENPKDVLRRMRSLLPHHYGPSAVFNSWSAAQLVELAELLLACFPSKSDPRWEEGEARDLGGDNDLRSVRDQVPQLLYRREGVGDHEALAALAVRHAHIREWLDDVRAQQGAESVIASLGRSTRPPGKGRRVPAADLLKLLQSADHRLPGSADDLQDVLLEELGRIEREARQHLSMLYFPKPAKGQERRHLHEDALQAYIACRLADRLPRILEGRGLKVEPAVDRETLAPRDTRNDIKVQAPSIDGTRLTVILEIKWSDNVGVSTNLVTQLGEGYLLQSGYTHGIYLVGWSGVTKSWKRVALGPAPEPRTSREAWQKALADQAELFCQAPDGLRIIPLVMDLAWEPEAEQG
jgi:hypothetical protein